MKNLVCLILIAFPLNLLAQEESESKSSVEFGISGNKYEYGEKGFAIQNGYGYQLTPLFKISVSFKLAYGFYRYSHNQFEPSFVEARYISIQAPIEIRAPGRLNFLSLGIGPILSYRSRFENDSFKFYGNSGTTRIYQYDYGYMYNTIYAGMMGELNARVYTLRRISFDLFLNTNVFFHPFRIDYYGIGMKTSVPL